MFETKPPDPKSYDPKLREAMNEINKILKAYDIGGFVVLNSKTHSEFKLFLDTPTWSKVRWVSDGKALHLKVHMKSTPKETEATVHMLYSVRDLCGMQFMMLDKLATQVEQSVKVEHLPFGGGIKNDDR
jgi:hypothetical protein